MKFVRVTFLILMGGALLQHAWWTAVCFGATWFALGAYAPIRRMLNDGVE